MYVLSSELRLSQPLSRQRVCPSPQSRGEGHSRLRVRGWGSPNSDDLRKSSALCLLCDRDHCRSVKLWQFYGFLISPVEPCQCGPETLFICTNYTCQLLLFAQMKGPLLILPIFVYWKSFRSSQKYCVK